MCMYVCVYMPKAMVIITTAADPCPSEPTSLIFIHLEVQPDNTGIAPDLFIDQTEDVIQTEKQTQHTLVV